ncbi:copper amine oxidase N-terminal domain-containing protein [Brevibacillus migulae]|uniref:copper amine oxidase N-terminal domain-containing protein n=1 Tax=Brevibacillus migulae TaxID=1644114 RepID=UPI00106EE340|nr:copper amine oxidase N-terminal domain-containing protein [Brevibacillus migulae]
MKKILTSTLLSTAMMASMIHPAFAIYDPSRPPAQPGEMQIMSASPPMKEDTYRYHLVVNGKAFSPQASMVKIHPDQSKIMVPLRTVAEALDYKLTWNPHTKNIELVKGTQKHSIQTGVDRYPAAQGTIKLGVAPRVENGVTFVPLSYFREVLQAQTTVAKTGMITITAHELIKTGTITRIAKNDQGTSIHLNGMTSGFIFQVSDQTEIVSADNQKLTMDDLQLGMTIETVHSPIMAMSLPPQGGAVKIVVKETPSTPDLLGTLGDITELSATADGGKRVTIQGEKLSEQGYEQIVLNIDEDTKIIQARDMQPVSLDELKKGMKVYAMYGPVVTRSLPPIGKAEKILVEM